MAERPEKSLETDITKIANSILDFEAQIDSVVFELYGLNVREANTIMHSLRLLPSYQQLVLKHFKQKLKGEESARASLI